MEERDWQKDWEMCQRATFGDWQQEELSGEKIAIRTDFSTVAVLDGGSRYGTHYLREDARFIVESREALPYWLQRVKELEERLKALEQRRCETCRWWKCLRYGWEPAPNWGECHKVGYWEDGPDVLGSDCMFAAWDATEFQAGLKTRGDFGCVCWEAKEAGP